MGPLSIESVENNQFALSMTGLDVCPLRRAYGDPSPILIDMTGDGLALSAPRVFFDITNSGEPTQLGWPVAGSDDLLLVFDRNENGSLTTERNCSATGHR